MHVPILICYVEDIEKNLFLLTTTIVVGSPRKVERKTSNFVRQKDVLTVHSKTKLEEHQLREGLS